MDEGENKELPIRRYGHLMLHGLKVIEVMGCDSRWVATVAMVTAPARVSRNEETTAGNAMVRQNHDCSLVCSSRKTLK
jgi:hypothetical protein